MQFYLCIGLIMRAFTREAVQGLFGDNRWLKVKFTEAELTREWQVRKITVPTTNILQMKYMCISFHRVSVTGPT